MMKNKKGNVGIWAVVVLALVVVVVGFATNGFQFQALGQDDDGTQTNLGESATLTFSAYTGSWGEAGAKTEVYPTYTVLNKDGSALVNDVGANSTTAVSVGEDGIAIYATGASYYLDAVENIKVSSASDIVPDMNAYAVVATTDLVITAYDSNEDALTADDSPANNTADYAGGNVLANDNEVYYLKMEQTGADKTFDLGAICTFIVGDEADDFEMVADGWTEYTSFGGVPDKMASTAIAMYDDGNESASEKGWKHCYVPSAGVIRMNENDDTGKLKFVFDSDDTTQPTANGDTYIGAVFLDTSYSVDREGNVVKGFFMDDDTEDPGAVGIDENPETTWGGLDTSVVIEPQ